MALETIVKRTALRVAQAFHNFAKKQGWAPGSYHIFMRINPEWGHVSVSFVADAFEGQDEQERYDDVRDFLEEDLRDVPGLEASIGLVIYGTEQFERYGQSSMGGDDIEIDDDLINKVAG
jgi:hypothetical protein